uniref:RNase H type-1 domain-containing protein n=1 Tax=Cannabis sativa TaxID=3483 RepID=A0A803PT91_CANSA
MQAVTLGPRCMRTLMSFRAATNNIPTCVNLVIKHVEVSTVCPVCKTQPEITAHALIFYNFVLAFWRKVRVSIVFDPGGHFCSWLELLFATAIAEQVNKVAMVCWTLWKARNNTVWKEKKTSISKVIVSAMVALDHWRKAQDKISLSSLCLNNKDDGAERWSKPDMNKIKLNVDAALFERDEQYGFGIVAQDHFGNCLEARAGSFGGVHSAAVIKALGIKEALSWIKAKNWNHVVIETDSLVTVQAIRSTQSMGSTFGLIIQDCRVALLSLPNVHLYFVKRSANRAAHYVARQSRFYTGCSISDFPIFSELQNILYSEC